MKKIMISFAAIGMLVSIACGSGSSNNGWNAEAKQRLKSMASITLDDRQADCYVEYTTSRISFEKWTADLREHMASFDENNNSREDPFGEAMAKHCGYEYPSSNKASATPTTMSSPSTTTTMKAAVANRTCVTLDPWLTALWDNLELRASAAAVKGPFAAEGRNTIETTQTFIKMCEDEFPALKMKYESRIEKIKLIIGN